MLGAPFIPRCATTFGVTRLLAAALLLGGAASLAFTLTDDYLLWLVLRFAVGLAVTVLFVLSEYWIGSAASAGRRGFAIGLYATSLGCGFAIGPVLLTLVGTQGRWPFVVGAALFWGALAPLLLGSGGAPPLEQRARQPFWAYLKEEPVATLAGLLHGAIEVAGIGLLPVYALRAGASASQGAWFASLFIAGNCASQLPLGLLSDRMNRHKLLLIIAALGCAGALGLAAEGASLSIWFDASLVVWGGIVGGLYPVGLAQLGARYRDGDLAGANAGFVMAYAIGMLLGPPLIGAGLDAMPPRGFFLVIAVLIGMYVVIARRGLAPPAARTLRDQARSSP